MESGSFFYVAFVYLAAAVVMVPIAKRFGLGSVLGYLLAGVFIGPGLMGLVGDERNDRGPDHGDQDTFRLDEQLMADREVGCTQVPPGPLRDRLSLSRR